MKISVITINRNNVAGLKKTLASVIAQTHNDVEFIVIDGASTDGSVDAIKTHAEHISQWISEPDTGIYNAMNKGIERATGDYLIFMNAGDSFADNNSITQFVNGYFQEAIVFGNQIRLYPDGRTDLWQVNGQTIDFSFFARRGIPHQSTFIQRTVFEKYGSYREDLPIYADWELVARSVLVHGETIRHVPLSFCIYDMDGMSTNADTEKRNAEKQQARLSLFSQQVWDTAEDCYELRKEIKKLKSKKLVKLMTRTSRLLK